jgi:hypothetical protein
MADQKQTEKKVYTIDEVDREVKLIEARTKTAKEQAANKISKWGMPFLLIMVLAAIASSVILAPEALPAVIGLVSTIAMATIQMLQGITGTKEETENKQAELMKQLIENKNQNGGTTSINVSEEGLTVESPEMKINSTK